MNTEKETAIRITLDKDRRLTVETSRVILPEAIQLCLASIEALCKQSLSRAQGEELIKSLSEDMYEMINIGASTLLNRLFPEIDMRPDLTVDAVMKAEDELIDKKGKEYAEAYANSAQAAKDVYEHNLAKANLAVQGMNREQRRKAGIKKK